MGKLFEIKKPEAGGDPLKLWETINEIIDALNNLSFTIVPAELASVRKEDGDIQITFNPPPPADAGGSSQPTSGSTPGDVSGMTLGGS